MPSAHIDTFANDHLPPAGQQPVFVFNLPELQFPAQLNCATELLDRHIDEGRGERLKETPETFSGLFWNGEEAVRLGLADGIGSLDQVARDVVQAEEVVDYSPQPSMTERLAKPFGASVGAGAVPALREMAPLR